MMALAGEQQLRDGLARLGIEASAAQIAALLGYVALLAKWNKVYNLTAIKDPAQMITHHLLDSLAVLPYIRGARVVDVGTGAGLPGIPLAIMRPGLEFVLLDSNNKKTRFVTQVTIELGLKNVTAENTRAETYRPAAGFDTVISRAFASLRDMLGMCAGLCAPHGVFLAMKGAYPEDELADLPPGFEVRGAHRLDVPGLDAERHVVVLGAGPSGKV